MIESMRLEDNRRQATDAPRFIATRGSISNLLGRRIDDILNLE